MGQVEGEFYELFRLALKSGQNQQDFWFGDPRYTWAYIDNYEDDQRTDWRHEDSLNYQLGTYVACAIGATFGNSEYPKDLLYYKPSQSEQLAKAKEELKRLFGM